MKTSIYSSISKLRHFSTVRVLTSAAVLALPATSGLAQAYWQGGTSDFNNSASWTGTYIDGSDNANPNPNCSNDSGSNNVVLIQPGDVPWYHGDTLAGNNANNSGAYLQTGSTNNTGYPANGNWLRMGVASGTFGSYVLSNGVVNVAGQTHLGENGNGYLEVDGGVYNTGYNGNPGLCAGDGDGNSASPIGTLVLTGGTINNINNETWFGENNSGATGYFYMNGGTFNVNNWFVFGRNGASGFGYMTGGTINFTGGGRFLVGGGGGIGSLAQSGGTINVQNQYLVPQGSDGNTGRGTNILSGTAVLNVHDWIAIGRSDSGGNSGYGELDISGNAAITRDNANDGGANFDVGGGGAGIVNQNGGAITNLAGETIIGDSASAVWNLNSGVASLGPIVMGAQSTSSGVFNLNGGLLQAAQISVGNTTAVAVFNFNGGILQATAGSANYVSTGFSYFQIGAGGAVIDSQNNNITILQALTDNNGGNASLTKNGSGTLILSGANSYGGTTTVNGGALQVSTAGSASGAVTVANTAGFGTLTASANSQISVASLTMGGATGGSLNFNLANFGNPTSAPLNVNNAFTANGTITVNIAASVLAVGTVPLLQYGSLAGSQSFVLGTLPTGVGAHLASSGNTLQLVITSAAAPRWNGNVTGAWDIGTNLDWYDLGTMQPSAYTDGSPVIFDDNASSPLVNLTATVAPASVNFNNNSLSYIITGTGKITGSTGLNLNGTGNVSILNTGGNTFTGPVVINGGVLSVTNLANGGSASALGASSSSPTNLVINGATFQYAGAPVTANRGFTLNATNSTVDAEGNFALSGQVTALANVAGGGSSFTKIGPAQLALTGTNDNELGIGYNPGVRIVAGTLLLDGSAGNQTNHNQNDFYVGCTTASGASLIVSNTTLNVDGWLGVGRITGGINNTSTWAFYNSTIRAGNITVGWDGGQAGNLATQIISLNGTTALTNYGSVNMDEGSGSTMWMSINDSSVYWVQNLFQIALANNSTGTVVVANSGRIIDSNGALAIASGGNSYGALTLSGNASASFTGYIDVAGGVGSTVNLTIAGGSLTSGSDMTLGDQGTAVLNMVTNGGGVLTVNGTLYLSRSSQVADGTVNLNPGTTIIADYVNNGWGYHNNYSSPTANPNAFNFNGGTLKAGVGSAYFIQPYVNVVVQAGGGIIDDGGYSVEVLAPLVSGGGNGGLTKVGAGTLRLDGVNTYTGSTVVSNGTLQVGSGGVIAGNVTVAPGATLAGDTGAIENYSINGSLTLSAGSTTTMSVTPSSNDQISGLTSVNYNGALVVTNNSGLALVVGHAYQLFNSALPGAGNFTSVVILPSGSGTFSATTGQLTITSAGNPPVINQVTVSGGNLIVAGTGGSPNSGYTLLTTTNLLTPIANWTTNATGTTTAAGAFSNAIPVSATAPAQFFQMRQP